MKKVLIFNLSLRGHHLEYVHHLYMCAIEDAAHDYIITYPQCDEHLLSELNWPISKNISWVKNTNTSIRSRGSLMYSLKITCQLKELVKQYKPTDVILIDFMVFFPFLSILIKRINIKGIIYSIYLYSWKSDSIIKRLRNTIIYQIISKTRSITDVFILADKSAAVYLNKLYRTSKFKFLCDPVVLINSPNLHNDFRSKLAIPSHLCVVLHAGDLSCRKGTLTLLNGLLLCSAETLSNYYFVFAGRVSSEIHDEFFKLYHQLEEITSNISLIEGFISFESLGALIKCSDLLFLNYLQTKQSSGFVGHAAEFHKPVVVVNSGLLRKIVVRNHLGYLLPDSTVESVRNFFMQERSWTYIDNKYLLENTPDAFAKTILDLYY